MVTLTKKELQEKIIHDALYYESDPETKVKEFETLGRVEFYKGGFFCPNMYKRYIPQGNNKLLIKSWTDYGLGPIDNKEEVIQWNIR